MANPLVRQLGLQQVMQRDAALAPPEVQDIGSTGTESLLAGHIRAAWQRNKLAKEPIERKLLACLRARRGVYSGEELAQLLSGGGQNIVWHDLTETKCRAASAWIREVVIPAGERPWGVDPTPISDLPMELKRNVVQRAIDEAMAAMKQMATAPGGQIMGGDDFRRAVVENGERLRAEAEQRIKKAAKRRAERMERQIADRQAEGGWEMAVDAFIEDFCTYPAAILKGPVYRRVKRLRWADGWKPVVDHAPAQCWDHVSPFDIYPQAGSADCQRGDLIEHERLFRNDLHALKGLPGYRDDQIDAALLDYSAGHMEGWIWTEAERQRLEQETIYTRMTPTGCIDALRYWGSVPGWKLISWGIGDDMDPTRDYEVECMLVGRYVVYAALNPDPMGARPYHKACYDEIPGAFWGRSVPDLCAMQQKMCNALACAMADNWAASSGPMMWVHMDRLADGEQEIGVIPWKVYQLKSDPTQGVNPGVGFFQPVDNSGSMMKSLAEWEMRADDSTGVPRYTYGNGEAAGAGDTASGLAMLMNNAAKGLRRAIGNIDLRVIQPTIRMTFVNEMLYNPDDSIKGDSIIVPRGAAAILIKEGAQRRRLEFLQMTANPIDLEIIQAEGRALLLREVAQSMDLPSGVVPDDDALRQRAQQQAAAQQQALQQQQAEQQQMLEMQAGIEEIKADRQAQRDERSKFTDMLAQIVQQAVQTAMAQRQQAAKGINFKYGQDGLITGGELVQ